MWEGKPLSPNALADDEYLASVAKDLGTNEWKPTAAGRSAPGSQRSKAPRPPS